MAIKIKLTPSELQSQATEMKTLETEYSILFSGVSGELQSVNSNWSPNLSHNFEGKLNSAQRTFTQITQELMDGATVANTCAVTFESVDSQLSKLYCEDVTSVAPEATGDLQTVSDVMQWIDKNYSNLPKPIQMLLKDACKKLFKNGVTAYEIVQMMLEGDVWGVIWKATGALAPSTFDWKNGGAINWTGLKIKAVSIVGKLVTDENGYIQANDQKYMDMMEKSLSEIDLLGFVWNGAGSFVQTVGKGTVDAACQLVSGAMDSITEKVTEAIFGYGVSWSTINAIMFEDCGWSPGHTFNVIGETISDGVDAVIDGGAAFWSAFAEQAYSDFESFGNLLGDATSATIDCIDDALDAAGDWVRDLF